MPEKSPFMQKLDMRIKTTLANKPAKVQASDFITKLRSTARKRRMTGGI